MRALFLEAFALIVALAVFGSIGYRLSKRIKSPVSAATWVLLVLFTLFAASFFRLGILFGFSNSKFTHPVASRRLVSA